MKFAKKIIFFSLFFLVLPIVFVLIAWKPITAWLIESQLRHFFLSQYNLKFETNQSHWDLDNNFIIETASIKDNEITVATIKTIEIAFDFFRNVNIQIRNPEVDSLSINRIVQNKIKKINFFLPIYEINITTVDAILLDKNKKIPCDAQVSWKGNWQGIVKAENLSIFFDKTLLRTEFTNTNASFCNVVSSLFFPSLSFSSGAISGELVLNERDFYGKLRFSDLDFNYEGLQGKIQNAQITLNNDLIDIAIFHPSNLTSQELGLSFEGILGSLSLDSTGIKAVNFGAIASYNGIPKQLKAHSKDKLVEFSLEGITGNLKFSEGYELDVQGTSSELAFCLPAWLTSLSNSFQLTATIAKNLEGSGKIYFSDHNPIDLFIQLNPFCCSFIGKDIQLEKFNCRGKFDFEGCIDTNSLVCLAQVHNLEINHDYFSLNLAEKSPSGIYYYDFRTGSHIGIMPLVNAQYHEKYSDLNFTEVCATCIYNGDSLKANSLHSFCNGILLKGDLQVGWKPEWDIHLTLHSLFGKASQFKPLVESLQHPIFITEMPVEGEIALSQKGAFLKLCPESNKIDAQIFGVYSDGKMNCAPLDMVIQDLGFNFDYDFQANALCIRDIQGSLITGLASTENVEEYSLAGEFNFTDYSNNVSNFDIWIGDRSRDTLRVVGKTVPLNNNLIDVILDQGLTHCGNARPSAFQLVLNDWKRIEKGLLQFNFQLETFWQDLQKLNKAGLFFLPPFVAKVCDEVNSISGHINSRVSFNSDTFEYQISGKDLRLNSQSCSNFLFKGHLHNKLWTIDELRMDALSVAAEITKIDGDLKFNYVAVKYGDLFALGLEGNYFKNEHSFKTKINLLEVDLSHSSSLPILQTFTNRFSPFGKFKAKGTALLIGHERKPKWSLEMELKGVLDEWGTKDLCFSKTNQFDCYLSSSYGIKLGPVKTALIKENSKIDIELKKAEYLFGLDQFVFDDIVCNVPKQDIHLFNNLLSTYLPVKLHSLFLQIQPEENLTATLHTRFSPENYTFECFLKPSKYSVAGFDLDCKSFIIKLCTDSLSLNMLANSGNFPIAVTLFQKKNNELLELCLSETSKGQNLNILVHPNDSQIQSVKGDFFGIRSNLNCVADNTLEGNLTIDAEKLEPFLGVNFLKKSKFSGIYDLKGKWKIENIYKPLSNLYFKGIAESKNCRLLDVTFDSAKTEVSYQPGRCILSQSCLEYQKGTIQIQEALFQRNQKGTWHFHIPLTKATNYQPSLIKAQPLLIRELELRNFNGCLSDPNTYQGEGSAFCINLSKEAETTQPFKLSTGQLSEIDLSMLTPAYGTVFYKINKGLIEFNRLKDVYSPGKQSKFYLGKEQSQISYISFDGILNLNVQMKLQNPIFRLADPITISIQGPLNNPTYAIVQKKND